MSFIINPFVKFTSGRSMLLGGVNEYVDCGSDSSIDFERTDAFSFSAWIYADSSGSGTVRGIVGKDSTGSGSLNRGYFLNIDTSEKLQLQLRNSGSNRLRALSTNTIAADTWTHVAITYAGNSLIAGCALYINGSSETLTSTEQTLSLTIQNSSNLVIGDHTSIGTNRPFIGYLDEITAWNKQLSASEVSEIYNSGCPNNVLNHSANANLISYWKVDSDDDMTHSTGNVADKVEKYALSLDGVNEYVQVSDDSSIDFERTDSFTVSHWIYFNSTADQIIIAKREGSGNYRGWETRKLSSGKIRINICGVVNTSNIVIDTSTTLGANQWHHLTFTYDGSSNASGVKVYFDGVSQTMDSAVLDNLTSTISTTNDLYLSGRNGTTLPVNGYLDEISIWNDELSASEVSDLYDEGRYRPEYSELSFYGDCVSLWRITSADDSTASTGTIYDSVGSNDGTPQNTDVSDLTSFDNNGTPQNTEVGDLSTEIPC
jgi:hypothetical protein